MSQALAAASASPTLAVQLFHHKQLIMMSVAAMLKTEHHGMRSAHRSAESEKAACVIYRKRLTIDRWVYESFISLRSRGGQALPAFNAARLASRIVTICLACDLVSL